MVNASERTALIVGASRGLGLGLVRELLARGWRVIGTVRDDAAAMRLQALPEHAEGRLRVERADVAADASADALADRLGDVRLDLLFLNAGVGSATDFMKDGSAEAARVIHVNAVGPARLARLLLDRVTPGTGVVAFMSSSMGSIARDTEGGWEAYRASKSAQNAFAAALAAKQAKPLGLTVLSLEPGWTRTDLGGPDAELAVETPVRGLIDICEAAPGRGGHRYLTWEGEELPW